MATATSAPSPASTSTPSNSPDIPTLIRFLTRTCSIRLAQTLRIIPELHAANLASIPTLASTDTKALTPIFGEDVKLCKKIISAAKRETNGNTTINAEKRKRDSQDPPPDPHATPNSPSTDDTLTLPTPITTLPHLHTTTLITNRAPLLLALTLTLLSHTHPTQPLSSRLSLSQALVSLNAASKATSIGLRTETQQRQADEGGLGRRKVRIMGREVPVMVRGDGEGLWGLDLERVKEGEVGVGVPVHEPGRARAYLLGAFASAPVSTPKPASEDRDNANGDQATSPQKVTKARKRTKAEQRQDDESQRHRNLALLLGSLEALFDSWKHLSKEELDRRAWQWYLSIRPDVEAGPRGWGGKGEVRLSRILELRK